MSTEANQTIVRRYYDEMWNRWDFALADELLAPGVAFHSSLGLDLRGVEEYRGYMRMVRDAFPDFHIDARMMRAEADKIFTRLVYTGTHRGALFGAAPTSQRITYTGVAVYIIRDGRITEGWVHGDISALVHQIGADPAQKGWPGA